MAARIIYPVNTPWGAQIAELASLVVQSQALAKRVKGALDSMTTAGAGPYTPMETELNLAVGVGTTLYNTVNSINTAVAALTNVSQIDMGT